MRREQEAFRLPPLVPPPWKPFKEEGTQPSPRPSPDPLQESLGGDACSIDPYAATEDFVQPREGGTMDLEEFFRLRRVQLLVTKAEEQEDPDGDDEEEENEPCFNIGSDSGDEDREAGPEGSNDWFNAAISGEVPELPISGHQPETALPSSSAAKAAMAPPPDPRKQQQQQQQQQPGTPVFEAAAQETQEEDDDDEATTAAPSDVEVREEFPERLQSSAPPLPPELPETLEFLDLTGAGPETQDEEILGTATPTLPAVDEDHFDSEADTDPPSPAEAEVGSPAVPSLPSPNSGAVFPVPLDAKPPMPPRSEQPARDLAVAAAGPLPPALSFHSATGNDPEAARLRLLRTMLAGDLCPTQAVALPYASLVKTFCGSGSAFPALAQGRAGQRAAMALAALQTANVPADEDSDRSAFVTVAAAALAPDAATALAVEKESLPPAAPAMPKPTSTVPLMELLRTGQTLQTKSAPPGPPAPLPPPPPAQLQPGVDPAGFSLPPPPALVDPAGFSLPGPPVDAGSLSKALTLPYSQDAAAPLGPTMLRRKAAGFPDLVSKSAYPPPPGKSSSLTSPLQLSQLPLPLPPNGPPPAATAFRNPVSFSLFQPPKTKQGAQKPDDPFPRALAVQPLPLAGGQKMPVVEIELADDESDHEAAHSSHLLVPKQPAVPKANVLRDAAAAAAMAEVESEEAAALRERSISAVMGGQQQEPDRSTGFGAIVPKKAGPSQAPVPSAKPQPDPYVCPTAPLVLLRTYAYKDEEIRYHKGYIIFEHDSVQYPAKTVLPVCEKLSSSSQPPLLSLVSIWLLLHLRRNYSDRATEMMCAKYGASRIRSSHRDALLQYLLGDREKHDLVLDDSQMSRVPAPMAVHTQRSSSSTSSLKPLLPTSEFRRLLPGAKGSEETVGAAADKLERETLARELVSTPLSGPEKASSSTSNLPGEEQQDKVERLKRQLHQQRQADAAVAQATGDKFQSDTAKMPPPEPPPKRVKNGAAVPTAKAAEKIAEAAAPTVPYISAEDVAKDIKDKRGKYMTFVYKLEGAERKVKSLKSEVLIYDKQIEEEAERRKFWHEKYCGDLAEYHAHLKSSRRMRQAKQKTFSGIEKRRRKDDGKSDGGSSSSGSGKEQRAAPNRIVFKHKDPLAGVQEGSTGVLLPSPSAEEERQDASPGAPKGREAKEAKDTREESERGEGKTSSGKASKRKKEKEKSPEAERSEHSERKERERRKSAMERTMNQIGSSSSKASKSERSKKKRARSESRSD